jgi:hypothetical protein
MGDNIKMDSNEIRCEVIHWIHMAEARDRWRALVDTNEHSVSITGGEFD